MNFGFEPERLEANCTQVRGGGGGSGGGGNVSSGSPSAVFLALNLRNASNPSDIRQAPVTISGT